MSDLFKTHHEAVVAFAAACEQAPSWKNNRSGFSEKISPSVRKEQRVPMAAPAMEQWLAQCANLPTPWPQEELHALALFRANQSRFNEILCWCSASHPSFGALRMLLGWGLDPVRYLENSRVSPLGYAAYAGEHEAVELLLQHTSAPSSRLTLTPSHLSKHTPKLDDLVGGTLLHRLLERSATNSQEARAVVDAIYAHDPDSVLCQTKSKKYPHQFSRGGMLRAHVKGLFEHRKAVLQSLRLAQEVGEVSSIPAKARKI